MNKLLRDSLSIVLADHGISFALNDTRRALSDVNKPALLRVPLFIKYPGQMQGQVVADPVMTVDILPTLLAALGISSDTLNTDGIDLQAGTVPGNRTRYANSLQQRKLKPLDESELKLGAVVAANRRQLKLDAPGSELWEIGPHDHLRGQTMDALCDKSPVDFASAMIISSLCPIPIRQGRPCLRGRHVQQRHFEQGLNTVRDYEQRPDCRLRPYLDLEPEPGILCPGGTGVQQTG